MDTLVESGETLTGVTLRAKAATAAAKTSLQVHGALGYTWEYDAQLYLKRSKWVKAAL